MIRINAVFVLIDGVILDTKFPGGAADLAAYTGCIGAHILQNMQKCCKINNRNGKKFGRGKILVCSKIPVVLLELTNRQPMHGATVVTVTNKGEVE